MTIQGGTFVELSHLAYGSRIDYGDGSPIVNYTGGYTYHPYAGVSSDRFILKIVGDPYDFELRQLNDSSQSLKTFAVLGGIVSIDKWDIAPEWIHLHNPTSSSHILQSVPNLPKSVICTEGMFSRCDGFNQDIRGWDVSQVRYMSHMFEGARVFNQDLSNWDVSDVVQHDGFDRDASSWTLPKPNFN